MSRWWLSFSIENSIAIAVFCNLEMCETSRLTSKKLQQNKHTEPISGLRLPFSAPSSCSGPKLWQIYEWCCFLISPKRTTVRKSHKRPINENAPKNITTTWERSKIKSANRLGNCVYQDLYVIRCVRANFFFANKSFILNNIMNDPKTVIGALIDTCRLRKYLDEEILVEETGGHAGGFQCGLQSKMGRGE